MIEKTVKVNISFQSLLETVSSLKASEKHQLLEHLDCPSYSKHPLTSIVWTLKYLWAVLVSGIFTRYRIHYFLL